MNLREASVKTWTSADSIEHINAGSLQRIADSMELISKRYTQLLDEREQYKRWYLDEQKRSARAERKSIAFKGQITRLKKRLAEV